MGPGEKLGDDERAGGAREPGDAQADLSLGERIRQLVECLPALQHIALFTERFTVPRPRVTPTRVGYRAAWDR